MESFLYLYKNLNNDGAKKLNSRVERMSNSRLSTSCFVNLFSDTFRRSFKSGGYISSYLVAISKAATPKRCSYVFLIHCLARYLSIIDIVTYRVSGCKRNFRCTSIIHSTKNPLEVSLTSFWTF